MSDQQDLPDLVAAAQIIAQRADARIADGGAGALAATKEIESAAVDIFTLFEARMQHHFRRGPFSRKLRAALLEAGQADLAERVYQHYLAVNVLKHGPGASLRELLATPRAPFVIRPAADTDDGGQDALGLIDVTQPGFFDGLAATILQARAFLERDESLQ